MSFEDLHLFSEHDHFNYTKKKQKEQQLETFWRLSMIGHRKMDCSCWILQYYNKIFQSLHYRNAWTHFKSSNAEVITAHAVSHSPCVGRIREVFGFNNIKRFRGMWMGPPCPCRHNEPKSWVKTAPNLIGKETCATNFWLVKHQICCRCRTELYLFIIILLYLSWLFNYSVQKPCPVLYISEPP